MIQDKTKAVTEIIDTVKLTGGGAHVFVPKAWLGRRVRVALLGGEN